MNSEVAMSSPRTPSSSSVASSTQLSVRFAEPLCAVRMFTCESIEKRFYRMSYREYYKRYPIPVARRSSRLRKSKNQEGDSK